MRVLTGSIAHHPCAPLPSERPTGSRPSSGLRDTNPPKPGNGETKDVRHDPTDWKDRSDHRRRERHRPSLCPAFFEEGAFVFICGRRQDALDAAVAELGPNARAVQGSVVNEADLDRLYAAV
ncbi:hypothetical protein SPHINGOT1_390011 [Sphingomonas sp. T1]|nr:hypothetical protein SPHINGOT1_390011 [Sphingomonas sp. T1]